jgi:hypothetical protein
MNLDAMNTVTTPGRRWLLTGYAGAVCAMVKVPMHVYFAVFGGVAVLRWMGSTDIVTGASGNTQWRVANTEAAVLIAGVAVLALALVRPWGTAFPGWMPVLRGRPVPRWLLLGPAFATAVIGLWHGLYGIIEFGLVAAGQRDITNVPDINSGQLTRIAHMTAAQQDHFIWFDITVGGVWFAAVGALIALAALYRLSGRRSRTAWITLIAACMAVLLALTIR